MPLDWPDLLAELRRADLLVTAPDRGPTPSALTADSRAVTAVLIGAGRLFERRDECPASVVETFLSYRGTTAAAIESMRAAGFEAASGSGLAAALKKSVRMGESS